MKEKGIISELRLRILLWSFACYFLQTLVINSVSTDSDCNKTIFVQGREFAVCVDPESFDGFTVSSWFSLTPDLVFDRPFLIVKELLDESSLYHVFSRTKYVGQLPEFVYPIQVIRVTDNFVEYCDGNDRFQFFFSTGLIVNLGHGNLPDEGIEGA